PPINQQLSGMAQLFEGTITILIVFTKTKRSPPYRMGRIFHDSIRRSAVKRAWLLVIVLLAVLCGAQWRSLRAMKTEISRLRANAAAESSRYVATQFAEAPRDELRRMV